MVTQHRATSPRGLPPAHKLDQAVIFLSHYSSFFSLTVTIRLKWNLWRNNRTCFPFFTSLNWIRGELLWILSVIHCFLYGRGEIIWTDFLYRNRLLTTRTLESENESCNTNVKIIPAFSENWWRYFDWAMNFLISFSALRRGSNLSGWAKDPPRQLVDFWLK